MEKRRALEGPNRGLDVQPVRARVGLSPVTTKAIVLQEDEMGQSRVSCCSRKQELECRYSKLDTENPVWRRPEGRGRHLMFPKLSVASPLFPMLGTFEVDRLRNRITGRINEYSTLRDISILAVMSRS